MNYRKIVSGVMDCDTKVVYGVVFEIAEGLYVRLVADHPRPSFSWSPLVYGKWDPYGVECSVDKVPAEMLEAMKSTLARIVKPDLRDIVGGSETYERVEALFGAFDEQDGGSQ